MAKAFFLACRIAVFGAFVVCCSVLCIVGILDLTMARVVAVDDQADIVAILVGIAGLLLMFPVLLFEVLKRRAAWTRVWFEIAWVAIFTLLYMIVSIALTFGMDTRMCSARVHRVFGNACMATRALIAFAWLGFIVLFQWLVALTVCSYMHQKDDSSVWSVEVSRFPWFATLWLPDQSLPATPLPFFTKPPVIHAEKRRPVPSFINWNRGGLGSDYVVEPYRGPSRAASRASTIPPKPPPKSKKPKSPLRRSRDSYPFELGAGISSSQGHSPRSPDMRPAPIESRTSGAPTPMSITDLPQVQIPQRTQRPPARPQISVSQQAYSDPFASDSPSSISSLPNPHVFGAPPTSPMVPSPTRRPLGPRRPSVSQVQDNALRVPPATWTPARSERHRPPPLDFNTFTRKPDVTRNGF